MDKMKTIVVTIALIFGLSGLQARGGLFELPAGDPVQLEVTDYGTLDLEPTLWAQNDIGENEKSESSKSDTETKKNTGSTDDDKDKASKSQPLKPFIPSEKIPGEQAVDFPVDI